MDGIIVFKLTQYFLWLTINIKTCYKHRKTSKLKLKLKLTCDFSLFYIIYTANRYYFITPGDGLLICSFKHLNVAKDHLLPTSENIESGKLQALNQQKLLRSCNYSLSLFFQAYNGINEVIFLIPQKGTTGKNLLKLGQIAAQQCQRVSVCRQIHAPVTKK